MGYRELYLRTLPESETILTHFILCPSIPVSKPPVAVSL
jgi:hypothetical protein